MLRAWQRAKISKQASVGIKMPKINEKTWRNVVASFKVNFSLKHIASVVKISYESIYHKIYVEIRVGQLDRKPLHRNRKKRRRLLKRPPRDLMQTSIENRLNLSFKAEFGHWKGDTVELVRKQSYLMTLVKRKM